ncbi:hypothetical protein GCM10007389_25510 [Pontibacter akesuensis]|nr:hypothetical protein GCM10007389_25510 [Pontibacter akesuensis]
MFKYIDTKLQKSVGYLENSDFRLYLANQEALNLYEFKEGVEGTLQELISMLFNHYNADMITATSIYNEDFYVTLGRKEGNITGRLYHNICSLSRDLRKFLYHKRHRSEELVNLDIRNSQPLFLNILLKQEFKDKPVPADVQHYIDLTSSGQFYEFLMDQLRIPREKRKKFKISMFGKIFYCTTHYSIRQVEGKLFRSIFPNVAAFIEKKKGNNDRGHKALSLEMQKAEADIIIGQVVKKLQRRRKFVLTIHDSTVVLKKDAEEAQELIKRVFMQETSLEPTINIESLAPSLTESTLLPVAA